MPKLKFKQDIAAEFGFSEKTLQRKLTALGLSLPRGYLSPLQQRELYEALGYPEGIDKEAYRGLEALTKEGGNDEKEED
ncbi:hypothetical protein QWY85_10960 [Neolewinella lacunae]|uniref:Uncharacterized protein n=1 Tax=Neolewinella lacunae TaxID=1517758 RepID=A0A923PSH6_9BACT|nr:hypothetical protein [Neolewinella lacunae]MBC6995977.1 hypothetical protein [Neolewinella lacunae]MDN3635179.1 hypothetical protein [Neolewinella lacunae]